MNKTTRQVLFWLPRGLTLLFAAFISVFALDVFGAGYGFWETLAALFIHLIPTWVILAVLVVAWRREWAGAIAFPALGVGYIVTAWGNFPWVTYLIVAGPAFLAGVLFLVNWLLREDLRPSGVRPGE